MNTGVYRIRVKGERRAGCARQSCPGSAERGRGVRYRGSEGNEKVAYTTRDHKGESGEDDTEHYDQGVDDDIKGVATVDLIDDIAIDIRIIELEGGGEG